MDKQEELKEKAKKAADDKLEQELLRAKFKDADQTRYKWGEWYHEFYAQYLYEESLGPKPKQKKKVIQGEAHRLCDVECDYVPPTNAIPFTTKSLADIAGGVTPLEFIPDTQDYFTGKELPQVPKLTSIRKLAKRSVDKRFNSEKYPLLSDFGDSYENLENASFADFTMDTVNGINGIKDMDRYDIETNQDLVVLWSKGEYKWVAKKTILENMKISLQGLSKEVLKRNQLWGKVENQSIYDIDKFWKNCVDILNIINLRLDDYEGYEVHQKDMRIGDTKPIWVETSELLQWKDYERPKLFQRNVETFENFGELSEEDVYNSDMDFANDIPQISTTHNEIPVRGMSEVQELDEISEDNVLCEDVNNSQIPQKPDYGKIAQACIPQQNMDLQPLLDVLVGLKDDMSSLKREVRSQQNAISEKQNTWQVQLDAQVETAKILQDEITSLKNELHNNNFGEQVQELKGTIQDLKTTKLQAKEEPKGGVLSGLLDNDTHTSGLSEFLTEVEPEEQPKPYTNADRKRDQLEQSHNRKMDTENCPPDVAWLRSMMNEDEVADENTENSDERAHIEDEISTEDEFNAPFSDETIELITQDENVEEDVDFGDTIHEADTPKEIENVATSQYFRNCSNFTGRIVSPSIGAQWAGDYEPLHLETPEDWETSEFSKRVTVDDIGDYRNSDLYLAQEETDQISALALKKESKSQSKVNKLVKQFQACNTRTLSEILLLLAFPCIMSDCGQRYITFSTKDNIAIISPVVPYLQKFRDAASSRPSITDMTTRLFEKPKAKYHKRDELTYYKQYSFGKNAEGDAIVFSREKVNKLIREAEKLGIITCVNHTTRHFAYQTQARRFALNYYLYKTLYKYFGVRYSQLRQIEQRQHFKFVKKLRLRAKLLKDIQDVADGKKQERTYHNRFDQEYDQYGCLAYIHNDQSYYLKTYQDIVALNELIKSDMTHQQVLAATTKQALTAQERRANQQVKRLCEEFNKGASEDAKLILSPVSKRPWCECGLNKDLRQNNVEWRKFDVTSSIVNVTRAKNGREYTTMSKEELYNFCCENMILGDAPFTFVEARPFVKNMLLSLGFSNITKETNRMLSRLTRASTYLLSQQQDPPVQLSHSESTAKDLDCLRWYCACYRIDFDKIIEYLQTSGFTDVFIVFVWEKVRYAMSHIRGFFIQHMGQPKFDSSVFLYESLIMTAVALHLQQQGDTPEIYFDCISSAKCDREYLENTYRTYFELYRSFCTSRKSETRFTNKVLSDLNIPADKNTS